MGIKINADGIARRKLIVCKCKNIAIRGKVDILHVKLRKTDFAFQQRCNIVTLTRSLSLSPWIKKISFSSQRHKEQKEHKDDLLLMKYTSRKFN